MLNNLLNDYDKIVFFDTETTGVDFKKCQIIEMAAYVISRDDTTNEMDEFIRPFTTNKLPDKIVDLTGITDEMITSKGKNEEIVISDFFDMWNSTDKTLLVAHNAQFDLNFLKNSVERLDCFRDKGFAFKFNRCDYLDTLTVCRDAFEYPHTLSNAIDTFGLSDRVQNSHRAIDDCKALFEVTMILDKKENLANYINLFGIHPKYGMKGEKINGVVYKEQPTDCFSTGKKLYEEEQVQNNPNVDENHDDFEPDI